MFQITNSTIPQQSNSALPQQYGFNRGLAPQEVINLMEINGKRMLVVKW